MKIIISFFIVVSLLFSCNQKGPKKPKNLIPKNQMVDLLYDMHLANKTRNIKNKEQEKNINYFALLTNKYQIDSTRFKASHNYYMYHINQYSEIYTKLEKRIDTLLKKQEIIVKIADSIKKVENKKYEKDLKTK